VTTTLGKEGSDFSAAIVGAALGASEVQIWTDVDGIRTTDPQICPDARRVRSLSFAEALELSCSGTKKPHFGTLGPASRANVPIRILDSHHPGAEGTVIGRRNPDAPPTIKSMSCLVHDHLISVRAAGSAEGLQEKVFDLCERFRPALMVLDADSQGVDLGLSRGDRLAEIQSALLSAVGKSAEVWVTPGRTVVSLVSEDLATHPELVEKTLAVCDGHEPRFLRSGVSAPVIRLFADQEEIPGLLSRLHEELLPGSPDEIVE
jgi:aspartate kinase